MLPNFDFAPCRARYSGVTGGRQRGAARAFSEFRELLVRTYATALLKYNDEKIVYLPFG
jgi:phospholipid transport system substrate-binding protein